MFKHSMLRNVKPTFYAYLMSRRNSKSKSPIAKFAYHASLDNSFPKQSKSYDKISKYLEEEATYLPKMSIFDKVWRQYQENIH